MRKVNLQDIEWLERQSPKGKFGRRSKNISVALGRDPESLDLAKRHPFDLALVSIPKGNRFVRIIRIQPSRSFTWLCRDAEAFATKMNRQS